MMTEHGVRADDYLAYVHQIDHSPLEPNPAMERRSPNFPGAKLILTNGSTEHAGKVLQRLASGRTSRRCSTSSPPRLEPKAGAADLSEIPCGAWRQSQNIGDV